MKLNLSHYTALTVVPCSEAFFTLKLYSLWSARTSESSEELPEEEPEKRVIECEDESSDKDVRPALETQPRLQKQDGDRV